MAKEFRDDEELDESISLESIRKELEKNAKKSGNFLSYEEIVEAVSPLDLSDNELENLVNYFKNKKIDVVVENADVEEDIDDISDIDLEKFNEVVDDDDDIFLDEDLLKTEEDALKDIDTENIVVTGDVKVNDAVKMYLREIGKVPLLTKERELYFVN